MRGIKKVMKFSVQPQKVHSVLDVGGKSKKVALAFQTGFSTDGVKLQREAANDRLLILRGRDPRFPKASAMQRLAGFRPLPPSPGHHAVI